MSDELLHVSWAKSPYELEEYVPLMSAAQRSRYDYGMNAIREQNISPSNWAERYRQFSYLVLADVPYYTRNGDLRDKLNDVLSCGRFVGDHYHICNTAKICPACSWRQGKALHEQFYHGFHTPNMGFAAVTFSYTKDIDFMAPREDIDPLWEQANQWLRLQLEKGRLLGGIAAREICISSIVNHAVLPHTHMLVAYDKSNPPHSFGGDNATVEMLDDINVSNLNLRYDLIESDKAYERWMKYLSKPVEIHSKYEVEENLHDSIVINTALERILARYLEVTAGVAKIRRYGCFFKRSKNYIGSRKAS